MIVPIETHYKGYRFRSRLEARWAVFFDALDIPWEYEKEGYSLPSGAYLPDFFIPDPNAGNGFYEGAGYWIEIKGSEPTDRELALLNELTHLTNHTGYLMQGLPMDNAVYMTHRIREEGEYERTMEGDEITDEQFGLLLLTGRFLQTTPRHVEQAINAARSARFEHGERP